jgi:predicted nuclease of predicted toxin-antitoxin system
MKFLIDAHLPPGLRSVFEAAGMTPSTPLTCRSETPRAMECLTRSR